MGLSWYGRWDCMTDQKSCAYVLCKSQEVSDEIEYLLLECESINQIVTNTYVSVARKLFLSVRIPICID